ncbi:MAG TPA: hypothetical protein VKF14_01300 [Candidatus Dormibacteraeota bacterium]|nr:hypothetical protein [Candidatus Dormibacteraeota bacterium]
MNILRSRKLLLAAAVVLVLLAINEFRPVSEVQATQTIGSSSTVGTSSGPIPWPSGAQAAIGTANGNVIAATPASHPAPMASVAKVMTALVVLDAKPLKQGETGPAITITPDDVTEFQQRQANQESVLPVQAGEQLTEYQALQGLLIPSANNLATALARWASGSMDAFVNRMNGKAKELGLRGTTFADAAGTVDQTVSTPVDMIRLGAAALNNPVLVDIVSQLQVTLPLSGTKPNVNYALGQDGIFGIKTGNISSEGAIYLFAGNVQLGTGRKVVIIGAVQGLPTLQAALDSGRALLRAAHTSLEQRHVVSRDQTVGRYVLPWGARSDVVSTADLDMLVWGGTVVRMKLQTAPVDSAVAARADVGKLHVTAGDASYDVQVTTTESIEAPSFMARLTRLGW